uniref:Uncharacterized protein n=1 Tax=Panagrolaimus sp. JU765 TaxID=591449 RepID=A0AC34RNL3_9BILA
MLPQQSGKENGSRLENSRRFKLKSFAIVLIISSRVVCVVWPNTKIDSDKTLSTIFLSFFFKNGNQSKWRGTYNFRLVVVCCASFADYLHKIYSEPSTSQLCCHLIRLSTISSTNQKDNRSRVGLNHQPLG